MESVFLLQHLHMIDEVEDIKIIGIYSTQESAELAVLRLKNVVGFNENQNGFDISKYELNKTWWEEGFVTL